MYWVDATAHPEWTSEWRPDLQVAMCISYGLLSKIVTSADVERGEDGPPRVVLVGAISDPLDDERRGSGAPQVVPLSWVCNIVRIPERRPKVRNPWLDAPAERWWDETDE